MSKPDPKPLARKTFVFTGTLSRTRDEMRALVEARGGVVQSGLSASTDYLVAGVAPGSKLTKAHKLKVMVIGEVQLNQMLS